MSPVLSLVLICFISATVFRAFTNCSRGDTVPMASARVASRACFKFTADLPPRSLALTPPRGIGAVPFPPLPKLLQAGELATGAMPVSLDSTVFLGEVRDVRQSTCLFFLPGTVDDPANDPHFAGDGRRSRTPDVRALDGLGAIFFCSTLRAFQAGLNSPPSRLPPLPHRRLVSADDGRLQYGEPEPCSDTCRLRCPSVFEEAVRRSSRPSVVFRSEGGGCWGVSVPWSAFPNRNSTSGPLSKGVKLGDSRSSAEARRRSIAVWGRCWTGVWAVPRSTSAPRLERGFPSQTPPSRGAHLGARGWRLRR